jgi:hypothetical protein
MKYYQIKPDVPGYLMNAKWTLENYSNILSVHYILECFPNDDLFKSRKIYIVKEHLANALNNSGMTGFELKACNVSKGEQFEIASPDSKSLPKFSWLYINGTAQLDDFGIADNLKLVVSECALKLLEGFVLENAEITSL